jgi:hypothetical protein
MSLSNGAVLFINNKSSTVNFIQTGIDLTPGYLTNIGINKMYFEKLPRPYNDCIEKSKKELSNSKFPEMVSDSFGIYNQEDCIEQCFQSYLFDNKVNCLNSSQIKNYFRNSDDKSYFTDCLNLTEKELIVKLKNNIYENELCSKECPTECNSIMHTVSVISVSDYPSMFYEKLLKKDESIKQRYKDTKNFDFKNSLLAGK